MRVRLACLLLLFLICHPLSRHGAAASADRILVSAAISLKSAFEEIGRIFEARSGFAPDFNFGASGILQKQIEAGAPVEVFASAGAREMDELQAKGLILRETRRDFARNALELIVPAGQNSSVASFSDLSLPRVQRLAIGNPKTVPAGYYAEQTLRNLKVWEALQSKLILAEDVRQVLDYVTRGEADAGMAYSTDVSIAKGRVLAVARAPEKMHDPILYPIAVIRDTRRRAAATQFIEVVISTEGQRILAKYGFLGCR